MSLRLRLHLLLAVTLSLIVAVGAGVAVRNARRSVEQEIRSTLLLALQLIEAGLAETRNAERPLAEWLLQLRRLEPARHLRIRVTGASLQPIDLGEVARDAPAAAPDWFHRLVAPDPFAVEQRLQDGRGSALTIRVEARPDDEIAEAWRESQAFLALLLMLAAAVYGLVHFTVGRAFRSVGTILQGLEGIERGEYGRRLPPLSSPEFTRIAEAFNHMAQVLERSRAENQALIQQCIVIQEEERRHLAAELHDELGQSLTAIKVMAAALRAGRPENREAAEHILALCDRLFGMLRGMMRRLRPTLLDELGLAASLEELVEDWRNRHPGLRIDCVCPAEVDAAAGPPAAIHLYRLVQEGLTNVVKHAEARHVRIDLWLEATGHGRELVLRLVDDGRGFDPATTGRTGFGLAGMRERVAGLGGQFKLEARPGRGVSLEVRIPANLPPAP